MEVQSVKSCNNEEENELELFKEKAVKLELENKQLQIDFNAQRAKMKNHILSKEEEFNKEKSRLAGQIESLMSEVELVRTELEAKNLRFQKEISSLEHLLHETVEESLSSRTKYDKEIRKLQLSIQQLKDENRGLKSLGQQSSPHHSSQESNSLASAVTKTLARKLGVDAFSVQENLEESMRRAQGDADMLRSLLLPLEEEIGALKDKLRITDEQLQRCQQCRHQGQTVPHQNENNTADETETAKCDMCSNYEAQLVREQQQAQELQARLITAEKSAERQQEELRKEIGFRQDMEAKWHEKTEEHRVLVNDLTEQTVNTEKQLQELQTAFTENSAAISNELSQLTHEREHVHEQLYQLQNENKRLLGCFLRHSRQLTAEDINLPNTVEELHEILLRLQEELILALVAKEAAVEKQTSLENDFILLQSQHTDTEQAYQDLLSTYNSVKRKMKLLEDEKQEILQLKSQISSLEAANSELRLRITTLQQDLVNSEHVQKDFVLLSQSLQVELEKIRSSDTSVRWQHEDDVDECPSCKQSFANTRRNKQHCRHCGQIFCINCLTRTVPSGPNQRPASVCDVCHTLLVKSSAPYFSKEPPHLSD